MLKVSDKIQQIVLSRHGYEVSFLCVKGWIDEWQFKLKGKEN